MASVKDIVVKPITAQAANALIKRVHYSGKVVQNSQLHFGVFFNGKLEGVMQFGPSLDKRKIQGLVKDTGWNNFIELNRMAFSDRLPRNSESRAIAVSFRLIKRHYPNIEWIISFADGAQCGDGTIYRASGFFLTGIKKNNSIWMAPNGESFAESSLRPGIGGSQAIKKAETISRTTMTKGTHLAGSNGKSSMERFKNAGWKPIEGYQLRYIYFLNPEARQRLTVPILPFSKIDEMGAGMYKGKSKRPKLGDDCDQQHSGGATPTRTLQSMQHPAENHSQSNQQRG